MKHLYVWVRRSDGTVNLAGELAATDPVAGGRFDTEFEYSSEWVNDPSAFSLDPASLPLHPRGRRFRASQFDPPLGVFDDALPDDWGRQLLTRALKMEDRAPSPPEMLLYLRGGGTGALVFTGQPTVAETINTAETGSLSALLSAAAMFEAGTLPADDRFRRLLEGSSRVGGARPKVLVHDEAGEWIAKFPSRQRDGAHDIVGLEATCLKLAGLSGLNVPESRLQPVGRKRVLLVRRFDIAPGGGRIHMISMRTLSKERPGVFATSYGELAGVLGKYSASPAADVARLFRHMAFNAAVGNVDDHLKNFWMLASPSGYQLAPAFDLVPDTSGRGEHTLAFEHGFTCPTRETLLAIADAWSVPDPAEILDQITEAVAGFAATARKLEVRAGKSLDTVTADVRKRVKRIAG